MEQLGMMLICAAVVWMGVLTRQYLRLMLRRWGEKEGNKGLSCRENMELKENEKKMKKSS